MSTIVTALINVWRFLRNVFVGALRRPPDFVWFEVSGSLPEFSNRPGFIQRRLRPVPAATSLEDLRRRLRLIESDGRVTGVVLRIRGLNAGWASIEELRDELLAYRRGGGRVVAYLIEGGSAAYYLATAADEILATPLATLDVTGVKTSATFLKDALERVGVEAEVVAVSPYKSAYDRFTRNDFSTEAREQAERLLEGRYMELVRAISDARGLTRDETRRKIDGAPYPASVAANESLLDGVCYEDEMAQRLGRTESESATLAEWSVARRALRISYRSGGKRVGVVSLSGTIVRGRSRNLPIPLPLLGGSQAGDESVVGALRVAEKSGRISSILFCVESGGGDALASDLIWREVERIRKKKPVVVLMGNVAASGGYYVGAAANHIVVRKTTVTGSIGVISLRPVAADLYERLGISSETLARGARADFLDASRRPSEEELQVLEAQILAIYDEFKGRVISGRGLEESKLEEIAGGRVWSGEEAVEIGLADGTGGFSEALEKARELGGIKTEGPDSLVKIQSPKSGRPSPGDPAEAARRAIGEFGEDAGRLLRAGVWLVSPYEFSDD